MNAQQRKLLAELRDELTIIMDKIEQIKEEEEEKYYNLPEALQDSEKGDKFQENIDTLDDVWNTLSDACDTLEEVE